LGTIGSLSFWICCRRRSSVATGISMGTLTMASPIRSRSWSNRSRVAAIGTSQEPHPVIDEYHKMSCTYSDLKALCNNDPVRVFYGVFKPKRPFWFLLSTTMSSPLQRNSCQPMLSDVSSLYLINLKLINRSFCATVCDSYRFSTLSWRRSEVSEA